VATRGLGEAVGDGLLEQVNVFIVGAVETFFAHEAPEPLNQIEIGRIGRQKEQLDAQLAGSLHYQSTALIAGIVHQQGHRRGETEGGDLLEQVAHTAGVDGALIGHASRAHESWHAKPPAH
jgi:hypothetical protein